MEKHSFQLQTAWKGGLSGKGELRAEGLQTKIAAPAPLGGSGQGSNPEELLLGAAATCYLITLGTMLESRRLVVRWLSLISELTVSVGNGKQRVESIVHRPLIELGETGGERDLERLRLIAIRAERSCMISKAMSGNVSIRVEPEVRNG